MTLGAVDGIARMDWLDRSRARRWLAIVAAANAAFVILLIATSHHGLDRMGRPVGTDFISFWSAARLVLSAGPAAPYDHDKLAAIQTATFGGADVGFTPFPYPPMFLLACLPFGLLPYLPALAVWLAATGAAYFAVVRRWLSAFPGRNLSLVAFPGVLINMASGQNGFLTTALFGTGALTLPRRPWLAGACFGALIFKPQLGLLIPIVLLAVGAWTTIAGAALCALVLIGLSFLIFGVGAWQGFLANLPYMSAVVSQGYLQPEKVQSAFAGAKVLGAGNGVAMAAQLVVSVLVVATLFRLARRVGPTVGLGAATIVATLLVTPYALAYDLTLLAVPLAWLFDQARRTGFQRWEKAALLAGFILPQFTLALTVIHLPIAPLVLIGLYAAVLRRAEVEDARTGAGAATR